MKRTFSINLGGKIFYIDEDAFSLLDNYLHNLKATFADEEGQEIVTDIEGRIAELFSEKLTESKEVISLSDVNEIIDRIGRPEEMNTEAPEGQNASTPPPFPSSTTRKRLFRDPDDKMLGGVASGIANYVGWNANLLRLLLILIAFFGFGTIVLLYIIAWILIPEAQTAEDRLAMRGESINLESIGQTVKEGFQRATTEINQIRENRSFGDKLCCIIGWILKIALITLAIIFSPVLFALAVTLFSLIVAMIGLITHGPAVIIDAIPGIVLPEAPLSAFGLYIGIIFAVAIPIIAIIWGIGSAIFKWSAAPKGLIWTACFIWIISVVITMICFAIQGFIFPIIEIHTAAFQSI